LAIVFSRLLQSYNRHSSTTTPQSIKWMEIGTTIDKEMMNFLYLPLDTFTVLVY
jgi:hypothetical protein